MTHSVEGTEALVVGETEYFDALDALKVAVTAMTQLRVRLSGSGAEPARAISLAITQAECSELWLKKGWESK